MSWLLENFGWFTAELRFEIRLRPDVNVLNDGDGLLQIAHLWGTVSLLSVSSALSRLVGQLQSRWIDMQELANFAEGTGSNNEIEAFSLLLAGLNNIAFLLRVRLSHGSSSLVTVDPVTPLADLRFPASCPERIDLSRFAYLQRHTEGVSIESAVGDHRVVIHAPLGANLIGDLAFGWTLEGIEKDCAQLSRDAVRSIVELIAAAGMLGGHENSHGMGPGLLRTGEFHDMLFHRRSRFGLHDSAHGATFPFLDELLPLPARAPAMATHAVSLPRPDRETVRLRDMKLVEAMESRVSVREYGKKEITVNEVGEFLFRCCRLRGIYGPSPETGMPYEAADRPYPSGGGTHDLEVFVAAEKVHGLPRAVYRYDASTHALETIASAADSVNRVLLGAMRAAALKEPPQMMVLIVSRFGRMSWKYRAISYSTTLKNVGVLFQTMYLVATAMKLGGCALGSGNDPAVEEVLKLSQRSELLVGEFMLGSVSAGLSDEGYATRRGESLDKWQPLQDQW